ncbi:MAG: hypothetical protein QOE88_1392 [Verrucomicrobiota bacterium]|nr:hypothetical protein [Verrucomicrobiota bacterium]
MPIGTRFPLTNRDLGIYLSAERLMKTNQTQERTSLPSIEVEGLSRDEQCPVCGGDNQCRVAKGHLYKGPCWCEEIIVPGHILRALAGDRFEPACLCRSCLETSARLSQELGDPAAVLRKIREQLQGPRLPDPEEDFYLDRNGNTVFTAAYHLKRGTCCGNLCRHCPF